jgi:hypothetical protein
MYAISAKTARSAVTRLLVATATTATVCTYCSGLGTPPVRATAAIVDTASIDDSASTIGIADSDLYGMSVADIDTTLDTLESIGVTSVRILVPWALVEPTEGTYNWTYVDEVVQAAAARNIGVLADVTSTPTWDAPAGTVLGAGTPNPTDYASFLTQVASRYGTDISSYEIWNEPNYELSYDPIDPATYTALLKAGYTAIKAVDPSATVIAAGLGAGTTFGNLTLNPVTFVQEMLADGASGYFDALSFHPYQESLEFSQGTDVPNSPLNQLNAIEALLAANGDASAKIWITEYGLPTADVSQQTQANFIQDFIDTWETLTYAGPVFIYTAQDGTSTDPTGTYGIYEADWTPKLAVAVIQAEIAKYAKAAVAPVVTFAQQLAAYEQAVAKALQAYAQQVAQAFAQAVANAAATMAANVAKMTAAPAVKATTQSLAAVTPVAATPAVSTSTDDATAIKRARTIKSWADKAVSPDQTVSLAKIVSPDKAGAPDGTPSATTSTPDKKHEHPGASHPGHRKNDPSQGHSAAAS